MRHIKRAVSDKRVQKLAREAGVKLTELALAQIDRSSEAAVVKALAKLAAEAAKDALQGKDPFEPKP